MQALDALAQLRGNIPSKNKGKQFDNVLFLASVEIQLSLDLL